MIKSLLEVHNRRFVGNLQSDVVLMLISPTLPQKIFYFFIQYSQIEFYSSTRPRLFCMRFINDLLQILESLTKTEYAKPSSKQLFNTLYWVKNRRPSGDS